MGESLKRIKSYILHLEPEFNQELQSIYIDFFKENGIPSKNKQGAVFDLCRSLPYVNRNDIGIRPEVLEASYKTIVYTLGDLNHQRDKIIGSAIKADLIRSANEDEPIVLRVCAVFWKERLRFHDIESIASQNGFSMEVGFSDWEYLINGTIYSRQEKPDITNEQVDGLIYEGKKIYDSDGNHVILLAGTLDEPIEFSGFGVIIDDKSPADELSDITYLEVANEKNKQEGEERMPFKQFETEADWQAAVLEIQNSYKAELKFDELQANYQTIQASLQEKENLIKEYDEKLKVAEANVLSEKERADKAEGELQKITVANLVNERKQILASKNYPEERIAKKEQWLATASEEEFNDFVEEIEALLATATTKVKTEFETKASQFGIAKEVIASINLTNEDEKEEKETLKRNPLI